MINPVMKICKTNFFAVFPPIANFYITLPHTRHGWQHQPATVGKIHYKTTNILNVHVWRFIFVTGTFEYYLQDNYFYRHGMALGLHKYSHARTHPHGLKRLHRYMKSLRVQASMSRKCQSEVELPRYCLHTATTRHPFRPHLPP